MRIELLSEVAAVAHRAGASEPTRSRLESDPFSSFDALKHGQGRAYGDCLRSVQRLDTTLAPPLLARMRGDVERAGLPEPERTAAAG